MSPLQLEAWVLRVADQVAQQQHNEDSLVELKSSWPEPAKAARRIAAHANAARGAPILWIIGVDEETGVLGADQKELANWISAVYSHFNQLYPLLLQDINVPIDGKTVVGLLFETDRAPFLVKNSVYGKSGGGSVEWEVPWREGRSTRTARRQDLVRILAPLAMLPEIECLDCTITINETTRKEIPGEKRWDVFVQGSLYVVPTGTESLTYPNHRCALEAKLTHNASITRWSALRLSAPRRYGGFTGVGQRAVSPDSLTVDSSSSEVIITGPGRVKFDASLTQPPATVDVNEMVSITLTLNATSTNAPSIVSVDLEPVAIDSRTVAQWKFIREPDFDRSTARSNDARK